DGLILTAESILNPELQQYIYNKIVSRTDTPVVVTGAQLSDFICIDNNVESDLEDVTNHLIETHGFTDIDILTGYEHAETSHQRVNGYKKALISHNISFRENKVIYGDFWMNSGEKLAMEYITGKRRFPQAVVCVNDYMAYGLCDTFLANDIPVPDKVTVVGYEHIGERYYHAPVLTTYRRNRKAVGEKAVSELWSMMNGTKPEHISLKGNMVLGNSCSCGADSMVLFDELFAVRREQYYSHLNLVGNFEQQLTLCRSVQDYINVLQQFAYLIRDVQGIYLCLYEDWCNSDFSESMTASIHNETMACYTVICPKPYSAEPSFYNKYELYPDVIPNAGNGNALYFCPIFFAGKEMGYFILQYNKPDGYDLIFRDWLKIASNALEILRMKNDINTLLACRNLSSFHDSVTGLYNEVGLKNELHCFINDAAKDEQVFFILLRTELFSDDGNLGHQHISAKLDMEIAKTLNEAVNHNNEFCAKLADKLYAYAAVGSYSNTDAEILADKLETLIRHGVVFRENCDADSIVVSVSCVSVQKFAFDEMIQKLSQSIINQIGILSERRKHAGYSDYMKLRSEIYRDPQKERDPQDICRNMHLSYGHFRATYKEIFGISFHQDIIHSKVSFAKYLLLTTVLSISSVADKCGYEDDKYFLRQFRSVTGITPNAYRKGTAL
ncbi:MAG: substrate-binding domain-containing protein, partial [Oscillospiraceae bacterium]|nr:substrate-binding domain-containing protein [Oscillospiraceae bacterium]